MHACSPLGNDAHMLVASSSMGLICLAACTRPVRIIVTVLLQGTQGAARIMRAAGAERIMLAHPDLTWERPSAATQASMSPQDLDDDFQAFMDRIDGTFSHPGAFRTPTRSRTRSSTSHDP